MRRQSDYDQVFRISRFQSGADKYWKPFVALLLGFNEQLIDSKYCLDDKVKELDIALTLKEEEAGSKSTEYDEIRGMLTLRTAALEKLRAEVNGFSLKNLKLQLV